MRDITEKEEKSKKRYSVIVKAIGIITAIEVILFLILATYLSIFTGAAPNR
jgi:hypothetical protein